MPKTVKPVTHVHDPRYLKALAHPLRIRILAILDEAPASPVQLAKHVDASLGTVAYHVRTLSNLGLIKLVATHQRRGATEHVYKAVEHPRFDDDSWDALGPIAKQRLLGAMLRQIGEYANRSAAAGGFDRSDAHITRTALTLDERGWSQLAQATKKWLAEADRIEQGAKKRLAKDAQHPETLNIGLVMMLFEALPFSSPLPADEPAGTTRRTQRRARGSRAAA
jgi:DNA-binding transcriptional ArsR family regulator